METRISGQKANPSTCHRNRHHAELHAYLRHRVNIGRISFIKLDSVSLEHKVVTYIKAIRTTFQASPNPDDWCPHRFPQGVAALSRTVPVDFNNQKERNAVPLPTINYSASRGRCHRRTSRRDTNKQSCQRDKLQEPS